MTEKTKELTPAISVVVPAFRSEDYLPELLERLRTQTLSPNEIVVVDSTPSPRTFELVQRWDAAISLVHKTVDFAYPGHARNIGVAIARNEWIAFIDCRTLPAPDWLERAMAAARSRSAEFVAGLCVWHSDSCFKDLVRAATFGNEACKTLPGSLVRKAVFHRAGAFTATVRAGEDLEWLARLDATGVSCATVDSPTISYHGFPTSLASAMRKWFIYAWASAPLDVRNDHKGLYLGVFLGFLLFVAYRWNAVVAQWEQESILYVPNITKVALVLLALAYFLYRGILRPLRSKVPLTFLLPWRWLGIGFVGFCLDLSKAPGLLWGAVLWLKRRIIDRPRRRRSSTEAEMARQPTKR